MHYVLVHGAWSDPSVCEPMSALLRGAGHDATVVELPMTTLRADVAATRAALDTVNGDVVLVGHSYGGSVIAEACIDNPQVRELVFIAAYVP